MNSRFPFLSLLSLVLRWIGITIFLCGFLYLGYSVFGDNRDQMMVFMSKFIALIVISLGIIICVIGEIIGVIFEIENNNIV